jgi:flagellar assembly protein FliH
MSSSSNKDGGAATPIADAKKFMFDNNDFNKKKIFVEEAVTYSEEQMALAKNHSFAQGKAEGLKEAHARQEERLAEILLKMSGYVEKLTAAEDRREVEKSITAAKLSLRITHKLLPQFAQKYAIEEIKHVIIQALEVRRDEPRIAVTVPTIHLDALKERIDAVAIEKGYAGKVILIADDNLAPSDCRVEWADGGAEKIFERLYTQIENEFAKSIAGMNATLEEKK